MFYNTIPMKYEDSFIPLIIVHPFSICDNKKLLSILKKEEYSGVMEKRNSLKY